MSNSSKIDWLQKGLPFLLLGLMTILVLTLGLMAAVPPVSRDALVHHLAVPKLYLQKGAIYEIPSIKYSYYPMNLELLYLIPLHFKNDIVPKFIHLVFGLLTGVLIFSYLNRRLNLLYALLGVISFLSLPVIVQLAITAYVDLGLVFFSTAALIFFFKWLSSQYDFKQLLLAGLFCGMALGTKYNGLLVLFLMALCVPYAYARLNRGNKKAGIKAAGYGALFVLVALIVFAPWMVRNYKWTRNPLFPLYDTVFNPGSPYPATPLKPFAVRRLVYHESWPQIVAIPLRIFFEGQDDNPQYFDGRLNPFLLLLPLLAFRRTEADTPVLILERQVLAAFAVFYILYAFFTKDMRIRYIAPALPALVLLSMFGLRNLYGIAKDRASRTMGPAATILIHGAMVLMLALNGQYIVTQFRYVAPLGYISGQVDRDTYIQKYRSEYAVLRHVNTRLPADARLLAVFLGRRSYYCDREMIFGIELLRDITKAARSPEEIKSEIVGHGLTHLIVGRSLYEKWQRENFNAQERARLNEFWRRYTVLIYRQAGYELYKLQNTSD